MWHKASSIRTMRDCTGMFLIDDCDLQQSSVDERRSAYLPKPIDIESPFPGQVVGCVFIVQIVFPRLEMMKMIMGEFVGQKSHGDGLFMLPQSLRVDPDTVIAGNLRHTTRNRFSFNN